MDKAAHTALNPDAPAGERFDAQAELQKSALASDLIPPENLRPVIDFIVNDLEEQEMRKALAQNVVPFPSKAAKSGDRGMQSVYLDDMRISVMGDYYEKPGIFGFDAMRSMVDQTPILSAVIMTRVRQVQRFCRIQESGKGPGFEIKLRERDREIGPDEKRSIELLNSFIQNCGWETRPRHRLRLRRDDFPGLMAKLVRDSLTMDSAPIETEWKRDKSLGLDGLYAVDGSTIRLCAEEGYKGEDEIFALQVVQGSIRAAYTYDDLIYVPRNPRSDVLVGGYGMSETELLIRVVTGFLNAFTYNTKYFDSNTIPKGLLHLTGNYSEQDLSAFRRYWTSMVRGVNNAWNMPYLVSKDQESKASFERFGVDVNEMMFSKWMTFLASMICAIYGISPDEINFESFSAQRSSLSGSDTAEKLADSKDKGLRPLLSYFESVFSDYIVAEFSDKYVFRWTGLDEEDEEKRHELRKMVLTVNEMRAQEGYEPISEAWGDAPLNPALMGAWQQAQQAGQEDYGDPSQFGGGDQPGEPGEDQQGQGEEQGEGQEGPLPEDGDQAGESQDEGAIGRQDAGGGGPIARQDAETVAKAFGLPVLRIL